MNDRIKLRCYIQWQCYWYVVHQGWEVSHHNSHCFTEDSVCISTSTYIGLTKNFINQGFNAPRNNVTFNINIKTVQICSFPSDFSWLLISHQLLVCAVSTKYRLDSTPCRSLIDTTHTINLVIFIVRMVIGLDIVRELISHEKEILLQCQYNQYMRSNLVELDSLPCKSFIHFVDNII